MCMRDKERYEATPRTIGKRYRTHHLACGIKLRMKFMLYDLFETKLRVKLWSHDLTCALLMGGIIKAKQTSVIHALFLDLTVLKGCK